MLLFVGCHIRNRELRNEILDILCMRDQRPPRARCIERCNRARCFGPARNRASLFMWHHRVKEEEEEGAD
jgi:hypothetical protein